MTFLTEEKGGKEAGCERVGNKERLKGREHEMATEPDEDVRKSGEGQKGRVYTLQRKGV